MLLLKLYLKLCPDFMGNFLSMTYKRKLSNNSAIPPGQPLQVVLLLPCGFLEGPFGMMF